MPVELIVVLRRKNIQRILSIASLNRCGCEMKNIQSNFNSSNTDGSFTMTHLNSFLSLYEILSIARENKYLGAFSYSNVKLYVLHHENIPI